MYILLIIYIYNKALVGRYGHQPPLAHSSEEPLLELLQICTHLPINLLELVARRLDAASSSSRSRAAAAQLLGAAFGAVSGWVLPETMAQSHLGIEAEKGEKEVDLTQLEWPKMAQGPCNVGPDDYSYYSISKDGRRERSGNRWCDVSTFWDTARQTQEFWAIR